MPAASPEYPQATPISTTACLPHRILAHGRTDCQSRGIHSCSALSATHKAGWRKQYRQDNERERAAYDQAQSLLRLAQTTMVDPQVLKWPDLSRHQNHLPHHFPVDHVV